MSLKKKWGWLLAHGVLLIVLGTLGLWMSFAMTLATVMLFGALLVVGGVFQLFNAFQLKGWTSTLWRIVIALLHIAAGVVIYTDYEIENSRPVAAPHNRATFTCFTWPPSDPGRPALVEQQEPSLVRKP